MVRHICLVAEKTRVIFDASDAGLLKSWGQGEGGGSKVEHRRCEWRKERLGGWGEHKCCRNYSELDFDISFLGSNSRTIIQRINER